MNSVILIGRLGKDLELTFVKGTGTAVAKGSIAVERKFVKDKKKETDFINICLWGKQAEAAANYTHKGSLIAVKGRIETGSYENKAGQKVYTTTVQVEEIQFLDKKGEGNNNSNTGADTSNDAGYSDMGSGDIPF